MRFTLHALGAVAVVWLLVFHTASARGQECVPRWVADFVPGEFDGSVYTFVEFDDGSGLALYAGGSFTTAPAGVASPYVARRSGAVWTNADTGLNGVVRTLCVHDPRDGSGAALFAGGEFWIARPGLPHCSGVARWNGSRWEGVGGGLGGMVRSLASVHDKTTGLSRLYAGGEFVMAGGRRFNGIGMWDGSEWTPLGSGLTNTTGIPGWGFALCVFDDGSGPCLHVGGRFDLANGVACSGFAKWDGDQFHPAGGVRFTTGIGAFVRVMAVADSDPPSLIIGGAFDEAGGVTANNIARWNGTVFTPLGGGLTPVDPVARRSYVICIKEFAGQIYAGGEFLGSGSGATFEKLARFNGSEWEPVGSGVSTPIEFFIDGPPAKPRLLIGGDSLLATWDGNDLHAEGNGLNGRAFRSREADLGDGPALYVVGAFTMAGPVNARRIAKWDGVQWSNLGGGFECDAFNGPIEQFNDGSGEALYVAGGGRPDAACTGLMKWDRSTWTQVPLETTMDVIDMKACDLGDGPRLYVLGDQNSRLRLSSWDGHQWRFEGDGVPASSDARLTAFRETPGAPMSLFVSGHFTWFAGRTVQGLVRFNTSGFARVGNGLYTNDSDLWCAAAGPIMPFGPMLYVAYRTGVGVPRGLAGWDGHNWTILAGPNSPLSMSPHAIARCNDGRGEAVYIAGWFRFDENGPFHYLVRWSASGFESVSTQLLMRVSHVEPMQVDGRPSLYFVGDMRTAGGVPTGNIARLALCPACAADWNADGTLDTSDFFAFLDAFFKSAADFNESGATDSQDFFDFVIAFFGGCPE